MATPPTVYTIDAIRGAPKHVYGRFCAPTTTDSTASPVTTEWYLVKQEDVSSGTAKAFVRGVQVGATQTLTISSVIYDTLQTSAGWAKVAGGGGNVAYQIPASLLDVEPADNPVRVEIVFVMADGTKSVWLWDVTVEDTQA